MSTNEKPVSKLNQNQPYTTEFKDSAELEVSYEAVNALDVDGNIRSFERPIDCWFNLQWAIQVKKTWNKNFRVNLWLSSPQSAFAAKGTVTVGANEPTEFDVKFDMLSNVQKISCDYYCSHLKESDIIKVDVTIISPAPRLNTPNAIIDVNGRKLKAHREILGIISPVFQAEFTHDTKESQTGTIEIKDFEYDTVYNSLRMCYGQDINTDSVPANLDMLRFADKYDITPMVVAIEPLLVRDMTRETFVEIATYAWDLERPKVKRKCIEYFKLNHSKIIFRSDFVNMNQNYLMSILQSAALTKLYKK